MLWHIGTPIPVAPLSFLLSFPRNCTLELRLVRAFETCLAPSCCPTRIQSLCNAHSSNLLLFDVIWIGSMFSFAGPRGSYIRMYWRSTFLPHVTSVSLAKWHCSNSAASKMRPPFYGRIPRCFFHCGLLSVLTPNFSLL